MGVSRLPFLCLSPDRDRSFVCGSSSLAERPRGERPGLCAASSPRRREYAGSLATEPASSDFELPDVPDTTRPGRGSSDRLLLPAGREGRGPGTARVLGGTPTPGRLCRARTASPNRGLLPRRGSANAGLWARRPSIRAGLVPRRRRWCLMSAGVRGLRYSRPFLDHFGQVGFPPQAKGLLCSVSANIHGKLTLQLGIVFCGCPLLLSNTD